MRFKSKGTIQCKSYVRIFHGKALKYLFMLTPQIPQSVRAPFVTGYRYGKRRGVTTGMKLLTVVNYESERLSTTFS